MAVRQPTVSLLTDDVMLITWAGLLNGDNGDPVLLPFAADKCWHVTGTSGVGGVARPKGHNKGLPTVDLTNDPILADIQGTAIAGTVNTVEQVVENTAWIYPHITAGDGSTNLEARLVARRMR